MSYILNLLNGHVPLGAFLVIVIVTGLIQISPLKLNPWDSIKEFFKAPAKMLAMIEEMKSEFYDLKMSFDKEKAISARIRILSFGESLMRRGQSTMERFDQILEDIDTYEHYCQNHPEFKNNKTVATTRYIKEKYYKCLNHEEEFLELRLK